MKAGVSKQDFISMYSELLSMTREGVSHLELQDDETVVIHYKGGARKNSKHCRQWLMANY